jgi:hypothetical protein
MKFRVSSPTQCHSYTFKSIAQGTAYGISYLGGTVPHLTSLSTPCTSGLESQKLVESLSCQDQLQCWWPWCDHPVFQKGAMSNSFNRGQRWANTRLRLNSFQYIPCHDFVILPYHSLAAVTFGPSTAMDYLSSFLLIPDYSFSFILVPPLALPLFHLYP